MSCAQCINGHTEWTRLAESRNVVTFYRVFQTRVLSGTQQALWSDLWRCAWPPWWVGLLQRWASPEMLAWTWRDWPLFGDWSSCVARFRIGKGCHAIGTHQFWQHRSRMPNPIDSFVARSIHMAMLTWQEVYSWTSLVGHIIVLTVCGQSITSWWCWASYGTSVCVWMANLWRFWWCSQASSQTHGVDVHFHRDTWSDW